MVLRCRKNYNKILLALQEIGTQIKRLADGTGPAVKVKVFISGVTVGGITFTGEIMAFQLRDDKTASAKFAAKDAKGNPAVLNDVAAASSDPSIFTVSLDTDGMGCRIAPAGPLGTAQVQIAATDIDGNPVSGSGDVEVVAGDAASIDLQFAQN